MNNRLVLNVKKENCFGYFNGEAYGLILGKVLECSDDFVTFDNFPAFVDYASIRRIEITPLNCQSFGWRKEPTTLSTYIIDEKSAVIFDNGQPAFAYKVQGGIEQVGFKYLDELQEAFRLVFGEELPIKRD